MKSPQKIYRLIINGLILSTIFASILFPSPTSAGNNEFVSSVYHDSIMSGLPQTFINAPNAPDAIDAVPTITINDVTVNEGDSGTTDAVFLVTLSEAYTQTVSVNYASEGGTAMSGVDYISVSDIVTFSIGITTQLVTVPIQGDYFDEINETFTVTLSNPISGTLGDAAGLGTIIDDDTAGISASPLSLITSETGITDTFTVALTSEPINIVRLVLVGDTTEGILSDGELTFNWNTWNIPQEVTITGWDDSDFDGDVTYAIQIQVREDSDAQYLTVPPVDVIVTNLDDELPIAVSPVDLTTSELGITDTFTVVLTAIPTSTVTIDLSSSDTGEGTVTPPSLIFSDTNWSTPQTVTVTGVDDDIDDGDQLYAIVTGKAISADPNYGGVDATDVSVTNLDDDLGSVTVSSPSGPNTTEAGGFITFTVVLDSAPSEVVTISVGSSDDGEGTADTAQLAFTSADWNDPQMVTVSGEDDFVDDGDQAYTINLGDTSSADPDYAGITVADVSLTNLDDDTAGVTADPSSGLITTEAGITATFTIVLNSEPTRLVNVVPSSSEMTEGQVPSTPLRFDNTDWNIPQQVIITGQDDNDLDGDQPYLIQFLVYSSDDKYELIGVDEVSVTNLDDEDAGISVWPQANLSTDESGGWAEFYVRLDAQPTASVTVTLYSSDESEGTIDRTYLTFTPGDYINYQTVKITGVDDDIDDGDQPYTIITESVVSDDENYNGEEVADISVTNIDDDVAGFEVTPISGLVTNEAGGDDTFTIRLTSQPTATVTIALSSYDSSEGVVFPSSLIFNQFNWAIAQIVTVTGVDDDDVDGDIGYAVITAPAVSADPVYHGLNPPNVSVNNLDNDNTVDTQVPTVDWLLPVGSGKQKILTNAPEDQIVHLEADASDNFAIEHVRFRRWDAIQMAWVDIANVFTPPYQTDLFTNVLRCGFNQINVEAYDTAGNNTIDDQSGAYIWLIRYCYVHMPVVNK